MMQKIRYFVPFCFVLFFILLLGTFKATAQPTAANGASTLYHPRYVNDVNGAVSALYLRNEGANMATAVLNFHPMSDATPIVIETTIPVNGVLALDTPPDHIPAGFAGSVVVFSDQPLSSVVHETGADSSVAAYRGSEGGATTQQFAAILTGEQHQTTLSIMNTGSVETNVTVSFSNSSITYDALIYPGAAASVEIADLLPAGYVGTAVATAAGGEIAGVSLHIDTSTQQKSIIWGSSTAQATHFIPHVFKMADLIASNQRSSILFFVNDTTNSAQVLLDFYMADGTITYSHSLTMLNDDIVDLATLTGLPEGFYSVVVSSDQPIVLQDLTFSHEPQANGVAEYDTASNDNGTVTLPRFLKEEDHYSVVSLQNVGTEETTAVFVYYSEDGVSFPVDETAVTIPPGASATVNMATDAPFGTNAGLRSALVHSSNAPIMARVAEYQPRLGVGCQPVTTTTIEPPPVEQLLVGVPLLFTAVSDGSDSKQYSWTVDGNPADSDTMTLHHTFDTVGEHQVVVTVTNDCGLANAETAVSLTASTIRYVALDGTCGGATPCHSSLQEAIATAQPNEVIKIAGGSYTDFGSRVLYINKPLTLLGSYAPPNWDTADLANAPTIIDAESHDNRDGIMIENQPGQLVTLQHLVVQNSAAGINLRHGQLQLTDSTLQNNFWGIEHCNGKLTALDNVIENNQLVGVYLSGACDVDAHVRDLYLENNVIRRSGTGVFAEGYSVANAVLIQNQITETDEDGILFQKGVREATIEGNTIRNNAKRAMELGVRKFTITNNRIEGNQSRFTVAASSDYDQCSLFANNEIVNNVARGTAVSLSSNNECPLAFHNNRIVGNHIPEPYGSYHAVVTIQGRVQGANNIIGNNTLAEQAVFVGNASTVEADHWTIANSGDIGILAESATVSFSNGIMSGQTTAAFVGAGITANHTLFHNQGATCINGAICSNTLNGDPDFVDTTSGNFHIQRGSAAFNQANSQLESDIDGDERPFCGGSDLGADEYVGGLSLAGLRLANAEQNGDMLTVSLSWPALTAVSHIELRYAPTRIDDSNWNDAAVLAAGLDGTATSYTGTVSASETPLFFALKYADDCGESAVSHNVSWPTFNVYLPIIRR
ncbi:MAG: right-handed parallel beta-helix repeat-containing protein [Anaerolineales bacterium]|nr:right-handed parallel beta-helix repeat-containing protein [Anaerolineales bacterium]